MMILTADRSEKIMRVASIPFNSDMAISMIITSGLSASACWLSQANAAINRTGAP
jgi:hypothetical protein